jgi:hypothetical protein
VNTRQREAHLRMLGSLPIRTHATPQDAEERGKKLTLERQERIDELLDAGGRTQEQIAEIVGVAPSTVGRRRKARAG